MYKIKLFFTLFIICSMLVVGCNSSIESPYPPLKWDQKADFPDGGRSSACAAVIGDKAYIFFGRNSSKTFQKDCWEYDSTNDTWLQKKSCPGVERVKAISIALNGKIYTGLGYKPQQGINLYSDSVYLKDFWMYDPQLDIWEERKAAPFLGTDACTAFVFENEIYVGMGFHNLSFGYEWWKYSSENDDWTKLNNFSDISLSCSVLCFNSEHIFFGTGYRTYNVNDWWEYIPENDKWKKRKSMPDNGRINGTALCVQNRFFVSTGRYFKGTLTGGHVKSDIIEYDPKNNIWYNLGDIPGSGRENAISFTVGNKGYIGLGENDNNTLYDLMCFEL